MLYTTTKGNPMIRKPFAVSLFFLFAIVLAACSTAPQEDAQPAEVIKSPKDTREYATITLDNNLEVLLVQDTGSEIAAVSLAVGVGSFQNPEHQQGLAHYLEHMLFLGTEKYPEPNTLQKFIDQNSGSWNAYTAQDHTNYFFSVPTAKLDTALDMFSDYFKAPRFDLEYSDKERNAVNSEWSMGRSQDGRILYYLDGLTGNPEHPASQLAVGNLETLADKPGSVLNDELKAFYERYYSANIMRLVMVSNLPLAEQEALARKHFAGVVDKHIDEPEVKVPGITADEMGKKIHYTSVMDLKYLKVSFPIDNNQKLWRQKPNEYVVYLIASEEPGTLAQTLREKNLAKALYAQVNPESLDSGGSFDIYADLTDEGMKRRDEIVAAIFSYLDLLRAQGVDEKYFLEQKAISEKKFDNLEMQQPLQTAVGLAAELLTYRPGWVIAHDYHYEDFNAKAVRSVLSEMTPQRARIWYISQNEAAETPVPFHEGKYAVEDITDTDMQRWQQLAKGYAFQLPEENELFTRESAPVVKRTLESPTEIMKAPGLEVWLTHSEYFQDQKGRFDLVFNSSLAGESARNKMLGKLLVSIIQDQQLTLMDRAQQAGIGINFNFDSNGFVVSLSEFNAKHPLLLERVLDSLHNWEVSDKAFAKAMDSQRQELINREKAPPFRQMFDLMERQLVAGGWSREDEKAALETISKADLLAFFKRMLSESHMRVFAYGNYSKQQVTAMVKMAESKLPAHSKTPPLYQLPYKTPVSGTSLHYEEAIEGHTDNSILELFVMPEQSDAGKAQALVLNDLLRTSFFTQLRTNEQLGYVVGTAPKVTDDYPGIMFFVQSNTADLPALKTRIDRFRQEFLEELEATDPAVIEQIKQAQLHKLNKEPSDFNEELQPWLSDFYQAHLEFDSRERLKAALPEVSLEQIVALYKGVIIGDDGEMLLVQVKGSNFADTPFAKH